MLFTSKPRYAVQVGTKLVQFNLIWEYETDDESLITGLSNDEFVSVSGKVKEKVATNVAEEDQEEVVAEEQGIDKLRAEYKEKFGKKAFAWWTAEQLEEKIAA